MTIRVGINGFGRIGRNVVRAAQAIGAKDLDFVAVNDLTDTKTLAHLLKYDSVHGRFPGDGRAEKDGLVVNGDSMRVLSEKDPAKLPWKDLGVDVVLESTGRFTDRDRRATHLTAGAKQGGDLGARPRRKTSRSSTGSITRRTTPRSITSSRNASCTTNCLVPVVKVILDGSGS